METEMSQREAKRFLRYLDAESTDFTYQTFDDNKKRADPKLNRVLHGPLKKHFDQLCNLNNRGAGVCVMINKGDGLGRKAENVILVRAVFVDLDGAPLEPVGECDLTPHIIVETSPDRFHCYWRVSGLPMAIFSATQKVIASRFGGDPSVYTLSRVMRLPGFYHQKGEPFRTNILEAT